jgi:AraC-like DNA-binding protein
MGIMFFPHIMYGLPIGLKSKPKDLQTAKAPETSISANDEPDFVLPEVQKSPADKNDLQLFTQEYIETIGASIESFIESNACLNTDFKLVTIVNESNIPAHHLTYYFNDIKQVSFSEWRNSLRIKHAMELIDQGGSSTFTLKSIAQQSGFSSQNTFIRAFKNSTGTIPSNYLKSLS